MGRVFLGDFLYSMNLQEILEYNFLNIGDFHLNLFHIIVALLIITIARIFVYGINRVLRAYFQSKEVDKGRQYAFLQVIKYIIYTAAILMATEAIGISLSVLWGGAAALMVGIGLGLQYTFNDIVSGLILLIEGTVEVGDIIEVEGIVGTISNIGIRTSKLESRDQISILIPNSKLVGDNATNWTHNRGAIRFQLSVGVSYSSDVELVTKLIEQAASEHNKVKKQPSPRVQFVDFGSSSLDFVLQFYSNDYLSIEFVKSDLRYRIIQLFRENSVEIPFPQTDLWLRNADQLSKQPVLSAVV